MAIRKIPRDPGSRPAPGASPRAGRRGPTVVSLVVAAVLLFAALFARGGIDRAAAVVARQQTDSLVAEAQATLQNLGRAPTAVDLERLIAEHEAEGLTYAALLGPPCDVVVAAGNSTIASCPGDGPVRVGHRVRVVRALRRDAAPGPPLLALELETVMMVRDLRALGTIVIAIAVAASIVTVLLGMRLTRSLRDEDRLRESAAQDQRLAALGQMSAVLAHEIKNPLASLKGNAQLLVEALPDDDRHRKKAERVVSEALRLEKLTRELLAFVRTGELRRTRGRLEDVARAAAAAVGASRVEVDVAPDVGDCLLDPERLQMAIENILRNALDSSGAAGDVALSVASENDDLVLTVRDRGPGIVAGEEDAIFQPFFTHKNHGTGLGLAVTRRIVELHGGRIVAHNHPEGGAVFRMSLPCVARR